MSEGTLWKCQQCWRMSYKIVTRKLEAHSLPLILEPDITARYSLTIAYLSIALLKRNFYTNFLLVYISFINDSSAHKITSCLYISIALLPIHGYHLSSHLEYRHFNFISYFRSCKLRIAINPSWDSCDGFQSCFNLQLVVLIFPIFDIYKRFAQLCL